MRSFQRGGLIKARIYGARFATADVLVYLDSHCEVTEGSYDKVELLFDYSHFLFDYILIPKTNKKHTLNHRRLARAAT